MTSPFRRQQAAKLETADNVALCDHLNLLRETNREDKNLGPEFTLMETMRLRFLRYRYLGGTVNEWPGQR